MVKTFTFGPFGTNSYLVCRGQKALLVDPAAFDEQERLQLAAYVDEQRLQITHIVATHGHLDHVWGAQWATERWKKPLLIHPNDFEQLRHLPQQQSSFGMIPRETEFNYEALTHESLSDWGIDIWHTPGHTQGCVCLYIEEENTLLSGDTLFDGGYGRTDLPGGNYQQLMESLQEILRRIPQGTVVRPGHGQAFRSNS